jgi:hypothetical protein
LPPGIGTSATPRIARVTGRVCWTGSSSRSNGAWPIGAALQVRERFYEVLCGSGRDTAFFVGNQVKREHVFSVLGVYWPPRVSR